MLGEVWTRALVALVVSHYDSDPSPVHVFFLTRVLLALSFLAKAGLVILLVALAGKEEDSEYEDQTSAKDNASSSWNDHP